MLHSPIIKLLQLQPDMPYPLPVPVRAGMPCLATPGMTHDLVQAVTVVYEMIVCGWVRLSG